MKHEAQFEKDLAKYARLVNCYYIKIPDTKMLTAKNRHINRESQRPFDGIFVNSNGNICIECKYGYNKLEPHQEEWEKAIVEANDEFLVLRKMPATKRKPTRFRVERFKEVYHEFDNIVDLVNFLKGC